MLALVVGGQATCHNAHLPSFILMLPSLVPTPVPLPLPHPLAAALAIGARYNKSDLAIWVKIAACFAVVFVCWDLKFGEQAGWLAAAAAAAKACMHRQHAPPACTASSAAHCQLGSSCPLAALPAPLRPTLPTASVHPSPILKPPMPHSTGT